MTAYRHARQDDGIGTYPYVVAYADRLGGYSLLVNALGGVVEIMVEGSHYDALC
jgi:hypothetical protein